MESNNFNEQPTKIESYLDWSDKNKHGIIRYSLGTILCILALFILNGFGSIPLMMINPNYVNTLVGSTLFLLSCFVIPFLLIPLIVHWVHQRPIWSVAMPKLKFEKRDLFFGFIITVLVGTIFSFIFSYLGLIKLKYVGFDSKDYFPLLAIGFIGVFIQAGAEELFFRGYLTQFLRRISKQPFFFIMIQALVFAYPHIGNVANYHSSLWVMMPYFIMGVLFGWVAYKTGSLWMSLGLHWGNNLSGMVLIGVKEDVLKTVAPFIIELPSLEMVTLINFLQAVIIIACVHFFINKKN